MFAKHSALAIVLCLFLSLVSALDVSVPPTVRAGTSVELEVAMTSGDPLAVGLLLCVSDGTFAVDLEPSVTVAATIDVRFPKRIPARPDYFVAAIEPGNRGIIYSKSNLFEIEWI